MDYLCGMMIMKSLRERACAVIWAVCLATVGVLWLRLISENISWYNTFIKGAVCTFPVNMILLGFSLFHACIFKRRFVCIEAGRIPFITADIISGVLLGIGYFLLLAFFSPPLPFGGATHCATCDNDISYLIMALLSLGLRYYWVRFIKSKGGRYEVDSGGENCCREAT